MYSTQVYIYFPHSVVLFMNIMGAVGFEPGTILRDSQFRYHAKSQAKFFGNMS